jgi:hypothetical protein
MEIGEELIENVYCLCLFLLQEFDHGSSFEQGFLCITCNQAHFLTLIKSLVVHVSLVLILGNYASNHQQ